MFSSILTLCHPKLLVEVLSWVWSSAGVGWGSVLTKLMLWQSWEWWLVGKWPSTHCLYRQSHRTGVGGLGEVLCGERTNLCFHLLSSNLPSFWNALGWNKHTAEMKCLQKLILNPLLSTEVWRIQRSSSVTRDAQGWRVRWGSESDPFRRDPINRKMALLLTGALGSGLKLHSSVTKLRLGSKSTTAGQRHQAKDFLLNREKPLFTYYC